MAGAATPRLARVVPVGVALWGLVHACDPYGAEEPATTAPARDADVDISDGASPFDAAGPADADAGADAAPAPDGGCPAQCNGGCAGGVCLIRDENTAKCPAGMPCRLRCTETNLCATIDCTSASSCRIECAGSGTCNSTVMVCNGVPCVITCLMSLACNSATIEAKGSPSLCMECGTNGCNSVGCSGAPAVRTCAGSTCSGVGGCGGFTSVASCD